MLRDRRHVDRIIPPEHSQRMLELASHVHYFAIQVDGYRPRPQKPVHSEGAF
jgi:hypothetical protein